MATSSPETNPLRTLVMGLLVAVLASSAAINLLLLKQLNYVNDTIKKTQPQLAVAMKAYNEGEGQALTSLLNQLVVFSKTNPDLAPILAKHRVLTATPATQSPAPAATPAK